MTTESLILILTCFPKTIQIQLWTNPFTMCIYESLNESFSFVCLLKNYLEVSKHSIWLTHSPPVTRRSSSQEGSKCLGKDNPSSLLITSENMPTLSKNADNLNRNCSKVMQVVELTFFLKGNSSFPDHKQTQFVCVLL